MYCEIDVKSGYDVNNLILTLSDGTANNFMYINRSNGKLEVYIKTNGVVQLSYLSASILSVGKHKLSLAYKLNDFVFYLDGVLMHSDTSGTVPSCNKINVGSYYNELLPFNNRIKETKLFTTLH